MVIFETKKKLFETSISWFVKVQALRVTTEEQRKGKNTLGYIPTSRKQGFVWKETLGISVMTGISKAMISLVRIQTKTY